MPTTAKFFFRKDKKRNLIGVDFIENERLEKPSAKVKKEPTARSRSLERPENDVLKKKSHYCIRNNGSIKKAVLGSPFFTNEKRPKSPRWVNGARL